MNIDPLATAYGIWQNGGSGSNSYTIAGGYYDTRLGINRGFLLNYDSATDTFSDLTAFSYNNIPGIVTHFEGITGIDGGYALAAESDSGAAFAEVARNADGSFGTASWVPISDPNTIGSTGDSVLENNLIGIYNPVGGGIQSYVATVKPPPRDLPERRGRPTVTARASRC